MSLLFLLLDAVVAATIYLLFAKSLKTGRECARTILDFYKTR
jgi:hypothetical protein